MLTRYRIVRGRRPPDDPLPQGVRLDVRKHTRHVLRPDSEMVETFLAAPTDAERWHTFGERYRELLHARWAADRAPFDALAELARSRDVYLGCSCPTNKQPDVHKCHTVLALRFMQAQYPDLDIVLP
jgi:uncharacterized protein YeaO (DUF488 family)